MKNKVAFFFLAIVGTVLFWAVGLLIGASYGGNYAEDYVALGGRGYEATGAIGASIGIVLAILLSFRTYHKLFCVKSL